MQRMHIWKLFVFFIIFVLVPSAFFFFPAKSWAQSNFNTGNFPTLQKTQTINQDYFSAGGTVVVSGTVNGDVYVAGGNVLVNGTINGDVLAAGGNVTVNGTVTGNVRVAGGQIVIGANVGKNVTTAGGSTTIQDPAKIAGSLVSAGGNISVLAPIGKGATFGGGQVSIDGPIGGDVNAGVNTLQISSGSHIAGSLNYWSTTKASIPNGVVVQGVAYHHVTPPAQKQQKAAPAALLSGFSIFWAFVSLVSSLIIGILFISFTPLYMRDIAETISTRIWSSLGIGFLVVIAIPILCFILLITIVGIPLAFIIFIAYILIVFLNKIFVSYAIGRKLLPEKNVLALLVGLVIYEVLSIIPFIGWLWGLFALFVGIGAVAMVERNVYLQARIKKII